MAWKIFHYNNDIDEGVKVGAAIVTFLTYIWTKIRSLRGTKIKIESLHNIEDSINQLKDTVSNVVGILDEIHNESKDFRAQLRELNRVINDERNHHFDSLKEIKENIDHLGEKMHDIDNTLELYNMQPKKGV